MSPPSVEFLSEREQPPDLLLLNCRHGEQQVLAAIARADLDDLAERRLSRPEQKQLVEQNLGALASAVARKYERGEAAQHVDPRTTEVSPLVELKRADLARALGTIGAERKDP